MEEKIPLCDIKIDKDGVWYYRGKEIIRKEIIQYFYEHLRRDTQGRYLIVADDDYCYLEVEDTPYVVKSVSRVVEHDDGEYFQIYLSDGNSEILHLESLYISKENVLYCNVKDGAFTARFSRPAYYQLAQYIEHDNESDRYFIIANGHKHYIESLNEGSQKDA